MSEPAKQIEEQLSGFFRERLVTLADLARERNIEFFPLKADNSRNSYYTERRDESNYVHEIDFADLTAELRSLLANEDLPELTEIAEDLNAIAVLLHEKEVEVDDISPFIYAMF